MIGIGDNTLNPFLEKTDEEVSYGEITDEF